MMSVYLHVFTALLQLMQVHDATQLAIGGAPCNCNSDECICMCSQHVTADASVSDPKY